MRALEVKAAEREMALAEAENKLAERDRALAETEALLQAREKVIDAMRKEKPASGGGSGSAEELAALNPEDIRAQLWRTIEETYQKQLHGAEAFAFTTNGRAAVNVNRVAIFVRTCEMDGIVESF